MAKIILDTNILIEILKSNQGVVNFLSKSSDEYCISAISAMELYFGALNKKELNTLQKFVATFDVLHISETISMLGINLIAKYSKSHNLHIADALIAATTINANLPIYTLNLKDFHYIDGLMIVK